MESELLKYTQEYDLQNRLKAIKLLNAKVAKCKSNKGKLKVTYEFTVQDDEILDPIRCQVSEDEETWLFEPGNDSLSNVSLENQTANHNKSSGSIWEWLGFSSYDIQLSNLYLKNGCVNSSSSSLLSSPSSGLSSLSSTLMRDQSLRSSCSPEQGYRKNIVDSRTYTRPKKRSFQTVIGRSFNDTAISDENADGQFNNSQLTSATNQNSSYTVTTSNVNRADNYSPVSSANTSISSYCTAFSNNSDIYASSSPLTTFSPAISRTNTNYNSPLTDMTSNTLSSSLGIIDIDQLTNSQLGFNNVLDSEETQNMLRRGSPKQHQERNNSSPFTASDSNQRSNWKYKLNETYSDSQTTKPDELTTATNSTNESSDLTNSPNSTLIGPNNVRAKLFNTATDELLEISFPKQYLCTDSPLTAGESNVPLTGQNNTFSNGAPPAGINNTMSIGKNIRAVNDGNKIILDSEDKENKSKILNNKKTDNNGRLINQLDSEVTIPSEKLNENQSRVETPPHQPNEFNNPVSFSTPTHGKSELKRKNTYDAGTNRTITENGINGRLSDSSTDTDLPSISMEDLTEEQISPIYNQTFNAGSNALNVKEIEKSPLNRTYELLPQATPVSATPNLTVNKSRNVLNNGGNSALNVSFRKSPLNTTFCKSTEALNGGVERADSGPEDDCMSTASDSSFSSSSTHMRSVGEIQSIARLQEESLRQQTPRRKLAWTGNEGLSNTAADLRRSIPKLPSEDGNQSDQSDKSSDRYSPTTLNNNDRGALINSRIDRRSSPAVYGRLNKFGGSSEIYPSGGLSYGRASVAATNYDDSKKPRMTGLRPPTMFSKISNHPPTAVSPPPVAAPTQPAGIRPTGIRPPSVIPRPVSRLPAPRVRSGLPKFNARGGRH